MIYLKHIKSIRYAWLNMMLIASLMESKLKIKMKMEEITMY